MPLFGWKLVRKQELDLISRLADKELATERALLKSAYEYIERVERELEYYRGKYDEALARADRQLDDLLQSQGFATVTETSKRDEAKVVSVLEEKQREHEKELVELFSETLDVMHDVDGLELPDELKAEAEKLIKASK